MLDVFQPFDVLNIKELKHSQIDESQATKLFTIKWDTPYVKMSNRKLEVFIIPLKAEASPFRLATQVPSVSTEGVIQVSLSGFLEMLGRSHPYLQFCLASYTSIDFHADWLDPALMSVAEIFNVTALAQAMKTMPAMLNLVFKEYVSSEWNSIFINMFDRMHMLEVNLTGSSEIAYQRQYFQKDEIYSDTASASNALALPLSQLKPRTARFYNSLFWDIIDLSLGA